MLTKQNGYFIKKGYKPRLNNKYFIDITTKELVYQPEVYKLAMYLAERSGARYIIDVGAGNGLKLVPLAKRFDIIAIDHKSNMIDLNVNLPNSKCLDADLEKGIPNIEPEILKNSIVVSADVIEHLKRPDKYLHGLAKISQIAPYLLLSTPDRTKVRGVDNFGPPENPSHVREWSLDELNNLIKNFGFNAHMAGYTINTNQHQRKSTSLIISGQEIYPRNNKHYKLKNIQAIVTVYNENDVIAQVVNHLLNQGVAVHVIDNWSNDGSLATIKKLSESNHLVTYERFPSKKPKYYEWEKILKRVEDYASQSKADWCIHHDADEIRVSPWHGVSLQEAFSFVDSLGYTAIDFTVLDFRPTDNGFTSSKLLADFFNYCEFGERPGHFSQVKAWKNIANKVEISSSGGHEAVFEDRRIYPIKFLTKHYPLRSPSQAKQKIFGDRLPRIAPAEKKKGWHIQYDDYDQNSNFVWSKKSLQQFYQFDFFSNNLIEIISGIGIKRN